MKPNLIVIMADQLRADVLRSGYTPNIDSLLDDGAEFANAYCASPLCVPARGAFFTGLCPNTNGSLINPWEKKDAAYGDVKKGVENLYGLVERDWYSIHSGKQHLFTEGGKLEDSDPSVIWASTEKTYKAMLEEHGVRQPGVLPKFKTHVPEMVDGKVTKVSKYSNAVTGCHPYDEKYFFDVYFTDKALEALDERDREKPLFLSAMYLAPHPPFEIPEPWFSKYESPDIELPENTGKFYPYQSPLQMYNLTGIVGSHYSGEEWREARRVYLGLVSLLDECVGRLIGKLKDDNLYDDSMIIFTSDHGEMLGAHRLFQKMCMYEESAHVPLAVKLPSSMSQGHKVLAEYVSHLDVMPTICDALGLSSSNDFEGRSLLPLIVNGDSSGLNGEVYIQYDGNGSRSNFQRCVIKDGMKLIADIFKDEVFLELYDLKNDRIESKNLIFDGNHDDVTMKLYRMLSDHMKNTGDMLSLPEPNIKAFRETHQDFRVRM
ncbi:MAG: sulfatase-like hydrolase/transferase [Bullifex sp.]